LVWLDYLINVEWKVGRNWSERFFDSILWCDNVFAWATQNIWTELARSTMLATLRSDLTAETSEVSMLLGFQSLKQARMKPCNTVSRMASAAFAKH
jgi:hypothetical protein